MDLTVEDIKVLIEAVEAWEIEPNFTRMSEAIVSSFSSRAEGRSAQDMIKESEAIRLKARDEVSGRKESAILLKAKLIGIKNKLIDEEARKITPVQP